jgi:hypothetical protein
LLARHADLCSNWPLISTDFYSKKQKRHFLSPTIVAGYTRRLLLVRAIHCRILHRQTLHCHIMPPRPLHRRFLPA